MIFKRLGVALAALFCFASLAHAAGTVPGFSLTPQFDQTGKIAPGCKLFVIQAGTVLTPQNAYRDTGLTSALPNPLTCDASGRLPQWFVADGTIKLRLTTSAGVQIFVGDNLLVVGASSGGGGGGDTVDPTTILSTGDIKEAYGTAVLSGFVRCNGKTIGSATSGASERANPDTQALFQYLWGADPNLAVSGGRGLSANADWVANKTLALPDCRGRILASLDDMGNTAAGRLTSTYFGATTTTLGAVSTTTDHTTLVTGNLPPYTPSGTVTNVQFLGGRQVPLADANAGIGTFNANSVSGSLTIPFTTSGNWSQSDSGSGTFNGSAQGGMSTPFSNIPPTILVTTYIKL